MQTIRVVQSLSNRFSVFVRKTPDVEPIVYPALDAYEANMLVTQIQRGILPAPATADIRRKREVVHVSTQYMVPSLCAACKSREHQAHPPTSEVVFYANQDNYLTPGHAQYWHYGSGAPPEALVVDQDKFAKTPPEIVSQPAPPTDSKATAPQYTIDWSLVK